jgi:hypothetical protein
MHFDRQALLTFYDSPSSWSTEKSRQGSHVSAITGLIGEDLVLALLLQHLGDSAQIVGYKCKREGLKGARLDAWIAVGDVIYQVEVKNWSAHSLGGYDLPADATEEDLADFAQKRWKRFFGGQSLPKGIAKVLTPMIPPIGYRKHQHRKILGFWSYVVDLSREPMGLHKSGEDQLYVFSASAYLRSLKVATIKLHVPRVNARISLLQSLIVDLRSDDRLTDS